MKITFHDCTFLSHLGERCRNRAVFEGARLCCLVQSQRKGGNAGEGGVDNDVDYFNGGDDDHVVITAVGYRCCSK